MSEDKLPPNPNPIIHLKGKTFGEEGGADPRAARASGPKDRYEVRRALRKIARHEFELDEDAKPMDKQMKEVFGGRKLTGAEILAATKFKQAMKNWKAMDNLTNDIDGKLIEKKVEAQVGYAELVAGSMQEEDDEETIINGKEPQGANIGGEESSG